MSVMIQVRNVPDETHRTLKARAATAGMSLSEYVLRELKQVAERPTPAEMAARLLSLPVAEMVEDPVDIIRAHRDGA